MPELPEVETVKCGIEPALMDQRIVRVTTRVEKLRFPIPVDFVQSITGQRVMGLRRRSKYILIDLSNDRVILNHLGMSGSFRVYAPDETAEDKKHDHVVLETDGGFRLHYNDPRRFGMMDVFDREEEATHPLLNSMGPEPLDDALTAAYLLARFKGRRTPIKSALLDQKHIAGLGNIYVCEALNRARINPKTSVGKISKPRLSRLVCEIKTVITEAIAAGGSSLKDHKKTDGTMGYFQHSFKAYNREGHACQNSQQTGEVAVPCGGTIQRIVQSGRSTFYCPTCQRS